MHIADLKTVISRRWLLIVSSLLFFCLLLFCILTSLMAPASSIAPHAHYILPIQGGGDVTGTLAAGTPTSSVMATATATATRVPSGSYPPTTNPVNPGPETPTQTVSMEANGIYVAANGDDGNDGSADQPFATLQHAADVATPGAVIHVAPGSYTEGLSTIVSGTPNGRITFISDVHWGAKIVTRGVRSALLTEGNYIDIIGFDVTGDGFLGIENEGSFVRIMGNRVHDIGNSGCNSVEGGAGIDNANYQSHDNDVIGNVISNIGPSGTCIGIHGIYQSNLRGHIWNNISFNNSGWGIHCWHAANQVTIANNLVFGNRSGGIIVGAGDAPGGVTDDNTIVSNNLVIDNAGYGIREIGATGTHNHYTNNLVYQNAVGAYLLQQGKVPVNSLSVDPQFVNFQPNGGGDYHLRVTSPAIDSGTSLGAPSTDLDNKARPRGRGYDIGPYEFG